MGIRSKMLFPLLAVALIMIAGGYLSLSSQFDSLKESFVSLIIVGKVEDTQQSILKTSKNALEQASLFSQMPAVVEAFNIANQGDMNDENDSRLQEARELLRESLAPILKGYKESTGVDFKVHFHLPTARSLVRMWRDKQAKRNGEWVDISDDLSSFRNTVIDINKIKKSIMGIEPGRGGFTIRGLSPVTGRDGRHLGSVEVLIDFDGILKAMESSGGLKALLYMDSALLPITTKLQDHEKNPVRDNNFVLIYGQDNIETQELATGDLLRNGLNSTVITMLGGKALGAFPIKDYRGKPIGTTVLSLDISTQKAMVSTVMWIITAIMLIIIIVPIFIILWVLQKSVIKPINNCAAIASQIARGDLKSINCEERSDEMGIILTAMKKMGRKLTSTISAVQLISEEMTTGCREFASTSDSLSRGATEQAAGLEEISSSMEEMAGSIQQTAKIAHETESVASRAAKDAETGGQAEIGRASCRERV